MINQRFVAWGALLASSAFHAWLFAAAPSVQSKAPRVMASSVVFQVVEDPPEPEIEPEVEPPPPEPEPQPAPKVPEAEPEPEAALEPEPADQPPPTEEPASEEAHDEPPPPELTGTTLSAEGADWSAPAGSGRDRHGPLRAGVSRPSRGSGRPAAPPPPKPNPRPQPVRALPLSQLSRPPKPPNLGNALQRNYPSNARQQGKGGEAKVRARIEPNGRIQVTKIVGETSPGFGTACQKTLLSSRWSAPLDDQGKAVATWISYRCKFRVDQ